MHAEVFNTWSKQDKQLRKELRRGPWTPSLDVCIRLHKQKMPTQVDVLRWEIIWLADNEFHNCSKYQKPSRAMLKYYVAALSTKCHIQFILFLVHNTGHILALSSSCSMYWIENVFKSNSFLVCHVLEEP